MLGDDEVLMLVRLLGVECWLLMKCASGGTCFVFRCWVLNVR